MASKKQPINKKTTLDSDYNKQAKQFTQEYKQLPSKKKKLRQLQIQFAVIDQKSMSEMTTEEINLFYQLKNEISDLEKDIINTENLTEVTNFYLKTGELLINYYD